MTIYTDKIKPAVSKVKSFYRSNDQIILRSEFSMLIVDVAPIARAHCLIIPLKHRTSLASLTDKELQDVIVTKNKIVSLIMENLRTSAQIGIVFSIIILSP